MQRDTKRDSKRFMVDVHLDLDSRSILDTSMNLSSTWPRRQPSVDT